MTSTEKHLIELLRFITQSTEQYIRAEIAQGKENAPPRHELFTARKTIKKRILYLKARIQDFLDGKVSDE